MELREFDDAGRFLAAAEELLFANEALHGVPIGIAERCREGHVFGDDPPWFGVVLEGGRPLAIGLMTPPHPLTLSAATEEALGRIVRALGEAKRVVPAVTAPTETARRFAELRTEKSGGTARLIRRLRLHRLDRVLTPPATAGRMRPATPVDFPFVQRCAYRFQVDIGEPVDGLPERVAPLDEGRLFVWEDQEPVAVTAWARPTPHGITLNFVYTPDERRGRGYASSLVSALSQHLLDGGKSFCCLFTDLANSVSNKIYHRIGYRPVEEFEHHAFD